MRRCISGGAYTLSRAISLYLDRHAEPERDAASALGEYERVLCVPSSAEGEGILPLLESVPAGSVLLIVVVNETNAAGDATRESNQRTLELLRSLGPTRRTPLSTTMVAGSSFDTLIVDRTHTGRPLPDREGVGLARKVAADIALSLFQRGHVGTDWIWCTDADAVLPPDYFSVPMRDEAVAYLYDFEHARVPGYEKAIGGYETHLLEYALGLDRAQSPYAFHTIGSTIAFRAEAYAEVRGFPRRAAAEDFYLLSKLAKVGLIDQTPYGCLTLSGRPSARVPFGTGAAVRKHRTVPVRTYDRRCYTALRSWLFALEQARERPFMEAFFEDLPSDLHPLVKASAGADLALEREIDRARAETRGLDAYLRHVHTFFDAFRTMKFVRGLRDVLGEIEIADETTDDLTFAALRNRDRQRRTRRPLIGLRNLRSVANRD